MRVSVSTSLMLKWKQNRQFINEIVLHTFYSFYHYNSTSPHDTKRIILCQQLSVKTVFFLKEKGMFHVQQKLFARLNQPGTLHLYHYLSIR